MNGGTLIASGTSDRPDGLFADQIVAEDVLDMRRGCAQDFQEILEKMTQQVFDNTLQTQIEVSSLGTGGTSSAFRDDIAAGSNMGEADGVRRHFSDRSVTESIIARVDLAPAVSSFDIRLETLLLSWASSSVDVLTTAPAGTTIVGVPRVRIVTPSLSTDEDAFDSTIPVYITDSEIRVFTGPQDDEFHANLNIPTVAATTIYVELQIMYPAGNGTSRNVTRSHDFWVRGVLPAWVDTTPLTATSDANRTSLDAGFWAVDKTHRELAVNLPSVSQAGVTFYTTDVDELYVWERLDGSSITIDDGVNAPYATTNYTVNTAYTVVTLTGGAAIPAGTAVAVDYVALRPLPVVAVAPDDSYNLFYQSAAVQTVSPPAGTQTLNLIPRVISKQIYIIGSSTGSPDTPFPYMTPGEQIPVAALPAPDFPESKISGPISMPIPGFGSSTGFLQIPVYVPYGPNPSLMKLFRDAPDVVEDAEGRYFWPKSDSGTPVVYSPAIAGTPLSSGRTHKTVLPILAELKEDYDSIGRKGTLIIIMISNWSDFGPDNIIILSPVTGNSGAGVYRVKGNMLNPRRVDP